ncbi:MAG: nucleotide exchange factor GrpE [Desulfobacterales bacterium]|nr:nucleotide exchange factor GrpE [Desulfobacterales bacterium]
MDLLENNRQTPDTQNLDDPSNLAKIDIQSFVVEKKGREFIFKWKAKSGMTDRMLRIDFPEISPKPKYILIAEDDESTFTPEENISSDQLYTMNIELQRKRGALKEVFFRKTINFRESKSFRFSFEEEKPVKSSTADMPQDDTHGKIETLVSKITDIDELLNGKGGLNERVNNLWNKVSPVLDVLRNFQEDSYLKKDFAEQCNTEIHNINAFIKSLEKQHNTFREDVRQIKKDYIELSHRIEAAENIDEKIKELFPKARPPQEDFLQSVWPLVEFKVRTLEKLILDHYNNERDRQLLELKELMPVYDGIQQILDQESNRLLPEDRSKKELEDMTNLFTPLAQDIKPIYKRIYSDPDTFLKADISALEASSVHSHLKSFEIFSGESLSSDTEIPDPDRFYREVADKYLNEVKKRYLEKMHNFSSQAYSSLDELRPDLEKIVAHSIFHFLDSTFHDIFQWHEKLQSNGRGFDRHHLEQVRSRMLELCGIQTIEPEVYKSKFDPDVHKELDQGNEARYSDHVILKIIDEHEPGYQIKWTGKVLRKCGVKVNYNTTG